MTWLQKALIFASLLSLPAFALEALAQSNATVQIRVLQSRLIPQATGFKGDVASINVLQIEATIQGQTYWMEAGAAKNGVLKPGEYSGQLIKDKSKLPYMVDQEWQLMYPDGKHENFTIVAIVAK